MPPRAAEPLERASAVVPPRRRATGLVRTLTASAVVVALLLGGAAYFRLAWDRADTYCGQEVAWPDGASSLQLSWSWAPLGVRCSWDDGTTRVSPWWSSQHRGIDP